MGSDLENLEKSLIEVCREYLTDARPGDWNHTLRTVEWIKSLMEHEGGDPRILIPAAYLHDVGWSVVLPTCLKRKSVEKEVLDQYLDGHMIGGAELSRKILTDLDYPEDRIERIVHLVSIHDYPEEIKDKDEVLLMEADRLDRFGKTGLERVKSVVKTENIQRKYSTVEKEIDKWFRTGTARKAYRKLMKEIEISIRRKTNDRRRVI